jgi:hypothetical protein
MNFVEVNTIPDLVLSLRKAFSTKKTLDIVWRKQQLKQILRFLKECRNEVFSHHHEN